MTNVVNSNRWHFPRLPIIYHGYISYLTHIKTEGLMIFLFIVIQFWSLLSIDCKYVLVQFRFTCFFLNCIKVMQFKDSDRQGENIIDNIIEIEHIKTDVNGGEWFNAFLLVKQRENMLKKIAERKRENWRRAWEEFPTWNDLFNQVIWKWMQSTWQERRTNSEKKQKLPIPDCHTNLLFIFLCMILELKCGFLYFI